MYFFGESLKAARYKVHHRLVELHRLFFFGIQKTESTTFSKPGAVGGFCWTLFQFNRGSHFHGWILPTKHKQLKGRKEKPWKMHGDCWFRWSISSGNSPSEQSGAGWLWFFCFQGPGTCRSVWFKKCGSPNGSWSIVSLFSALESDERSGFRCFYLVYCSLITHQSEIPSSNSKWIAGHKAVACKYPKKAYTNTLLWVETGLNYNPLKISWTPNKPFQKKSKSCNIQSSKKHEPAPKTNEYSIISPKNGFQQIFGYSVLFKPAILRGPCSLGFWGGQKNHQKPPPSLRHHFLLYPQLLKVKPYPFKTTTTRSPESDSVSLGPEVENVVP